MTKNQLMGLAIGLVAGIAAFGTTIYVVAATAVPEREATTPPARGAVSGFVPTISKEADPVYPRRTAEAPRSRSVPSDMAVYRYCESVFPKYDAIYSQFGPDWRKAEELMFQDAARHFGITSSQARSAYLRTGRSGY